MVNYSIKSEIIFDLINELSKNLSEDEIVDKAVPIYMNKLDCFMAYLEKNNGGTNEQKFFQQSIPNLNQNWSSIKDRFIKIRIENTVDPVIELVDGDSLYYAFQLKNYGCLVLARKTLLDPNIINDILPLMNFLGRNLVLAAGNSHESAKEASKAKEMFLANMSHEIRTPLNGIIGMVRQLSKEDLNKTQNQYVENTHRASQHLLSIVNNILDITKIETGEMNIDSNVFSISTLLNDVSSVLSFQAEKKNIKFELFIDSNVNDILKGDKARIQQILTNVTGNAIKFTSYGKVRVECKSILNINDCQHIEFKIIDTGIGMKEDYVKKIFDKFQQEDSSTSRNYGGSGLGLFITKKLVDLMNGDVTVNSKKGEGTVFNIVIPMEIDRLQEEPKISNINPDHNENRKLNILLVEDNQMNRLVAINTLKLIAYNIDEADNGKKAVDLVKKNNYDLILMDIQMPVMNGMEATNLIRNELKDNTPIIALSANAFKSEIDSCLQLGMSDYITKPFDEDSLLQSIHNHSNKNNIMNNEDNKTKEMPNTNVKQYDLSKLEAMARGNDNFIKKMLALFIETFPPYVNEMKEAINNGGGDDIIALKQLAHKIKPSLSDMGIITVIQDVKDIEAFDVENGSITELRNKVDYVSKVLSLAIEQIKNDEL